MKKQLIRLTEADLHNIIRDSVMRIIKEEGEGGATACGNVMQGGGSNPSAGQYDVPFGADKATSKRSKNFKNGSMTMQHADNEGTDVINKQIYRPRK